MVQIQEEPPELDLDDILIETVEPPIPGVFFGKDIEKLTMPYDRFVAGLGSNYDLILPNSVFRGTTECVVVVDIIGAQDGDLSCLIRFAEGAKVYSYDGSTHLKLPENHILDKDWKVHSSEPETELNVKASEMKTLVYVRK